MLSPKEISMMISKLDEPNLQVKFFMAFRLLSEIRSELRVHQRILDLTQNSLDTLLEKFTEQATIEELKHMKMDSSLMEIDNLVEIINDKIRKWQDHQE